MAKSQSRQTRRIAPGPSARQGMRKGKSATGQPARRASRPSQPTRATSGQSRARTAKRQTGSRTALEQMTRQQLYQKARKAGIQGRSEMNKAQLLRALRNR